MYLGSPFLCTLYISYTLLGPCSLGMAMSILYFLYLTGPYPWDVGNVCFTFLLCVMALCKIYIYIYICLCVCGWSCTLYDGLSWLSERPFLVIRALDLVAWLCAQGICCKCILMSYCVHSHRDVTVSIHVTKWHWFPRVCDTHQYAWCFEGLARPSTSTLACAVYTGMKHYRCTIAHQTRRFARFSLWK